MDNPLVGSASVKSTVICASSYILVLNCTTIYLMFALFKRNTHKLLNTLAKTEKHSKLYSPAISRVHFQDLRKKDNRSRLEPTENWFFNLQNSDHLPFARTCAMQIRTRWWFSIWMISVRPTTYYNDRRERVWKIHIGAHNTPINDQQQQQQQLSIGATWVKIS